VARVWITDGSVPVFSDTRRLKASHRGLLGLPVRYEGFVDPAVDRGSASIHAERPDDELFVEAEWLVELAGLRDAAELDESTTVVLQGMIEGKWMNRLLGTKAWQPASIGNNVIAEGPGVRTTLGALESGADGEVRIEYPRADGSRQIWRSTLADLRGQNVPDLVREVAALGEQLDGINLGAFGEEAAVVNEPRRLKSSMRAILPHRGKERLVRAALADGIGVPPGAEVTVRTSAGGEIVGRGALAWERV
jgi:hypothetical protein